MTNSSSFPTLADIQKAILSADRVFKCSPNDLLDTAFSKTKSSHDAVFVFDPAGDFMGVVSPSYSLFQKRYPFNTKVKSCLIGPPHITMATPLAHIADFMAHSRIYTLPIFSSNGKVSGIITARKLLKATLQYPELFAQLAKNLRPDAVPLAPISSTAKSVYQIIRAKKYSRVVVVDENGKLAGLVTRHDLQLPLIKPTTHQRFRTGGKGNTRDYTFGIEKESRLDSPITQFIQHNVFALGDQTPKQDIARQLIASDTNSVVLLNSESKPTGIISMRHLLQALANAQPVAESPILFTNSAKLAESEMAPLQEAAERLEQKMAKRSPLQRMEITIRESRTQHHTPIEFEIALHVLFYSGKTLFADAKDKDLYQAMHEAIKKVEAQARKEKD
ncbi:MAG: hypothetical protein A2748_02145 [Candidatus Wildermuthbacteria bacterium RIFCSPHIGHO2_01_FULL_45_20]|uniref:CBS domain-containing protein n=1 Tax=Candidatus Wildermuthbacteria bacterium RIFCSPHIGHO2_02_FULL_45_25 TaxID=1802450 RepID=A0A1G2R0C4_9BACT|nr:MAG: hypothetical protein A2748_02145 [Candidatus Wildermuthbacteria bacterium RIFCSPHIGHO2_01_FULL_45_20]OHA65722.1 MAG: hypothetical protein A3C04_02290 [Candidatus Wildermuthbacteria bacterium RIFCSPHIGHO2_02_FULL_45_25]